MNKAVPIAVGVAIAIVAVLNLLRYWRRPSERSFRCGGCSAPTVHTGRTIEAWRIGKRKFFCDACHARWVESRPAQVPSRRAESSGCLGIIVVAVMPPVITYLAIKVLT